MSHPQGTLWESIWDLWGACVAHRQGGFGVPSAARSPFQKTSESPVVGLGRVLVHEDSSDVARQVILDLDPLCACTAAGISGKTVPRGYAPVEVKRGHYCHKQGKQWLLHYCSSAQAKSFTTAATSR